jgi:hypothetical protein
MVKKGSDQPMLVGIYEHYKGGLYEMAEVEDS